MILLFRGRVRRQFPFSFLLFSLLSPLFLFPSSSSFSPHLRQSMFLTMAWEKKLQDRGWRWGLGIGWGWGSGWGWRLMTDPPSQPRWRKKAFPLTSQSHWWWPACPQEKHSSGWSLYLIVTQPKVSVFSLPGMSLLIFNFRVLSPVFYGCVAPCCMGRPYRNFPILG